MKLLFLGVGTIAQAVQRASPEHMAAGTTRSVPDARFAKIQPISALDTAAIQRAAEGAHVVVSFPPDDRTDADVAPLARTAASIVYLSSTAVYPASATRVTEETAPRAESERARRRLAAESIWSAVGARIVRLPAFYGTDTGLHVSIARGTFRLPGDGSNIVSRVHVDDAARFVLAAFEAPPQTIILAGDDMPAPVIEVVRFVCAELGLALPPSSAGDAIPESLRSSRSVDNRGTKARFRIRLAHPSYHSGYRAIAQQLRGK